jgi:hypothetical protein
MAGSPLRFARHDDAVGCSRISHVVMAGLVPAIHVLFFPEDWIARLRGRRQKR